MIAIKKSKNAKAQEWVKLAIKKTNQTQNEGKKKVEQFVNIAKEVSQDFEKRVEEGRSKVLSFLQIPSNVELKKVSKKVDQLNKKLDSLAKRKK